MRVDDGPTPVFWVLIIGHKQGWDYTLHVSEADARAELATYCRTWWEERQLAMPLPLDDDAVIDRYFDAVPEEWDIGMRSVAARHVGE
jgi:hypothetical protein